MQCLYFSYLFLFKWETILQFTRGSAVLMRQGQDKTISKVIAIKAFASVTFWIIVKSIFVSIY